MTSHHAPTGDVVADALAALPGMLPDQGPIGVFVHHNTLHAYQHLSFEEAVVSGGRELGARAWPDIALLRAAWATGRIEDKDVEAVLTVPVDAPLPLGLTRRRLRLILLRNDIDIDDAAGAAFVAGDDPVFARALALAVADVAPATAASPVAPAVRHRDALLALGAGDVDDVVNAELVRLGLSHLDLGQAPERLQGRERGFLLAAASALSSSPPRLCPSVGEDAARVVREGLSARTVIDDVFVALDVNEADRGAWLTAAALALRGIAGMFSRLERHPDEAAAPASLLEFLAVRLLLERRAVEHAAKSASLPTALPTALTPLRALVPAPPSPPAACRAWLLRGIAAAAGHDLQGTSVDDARGLWTEADGFRREERNRLLFLAYERAYRRRVLTGIVALQKRRATRATTTPATKTRPPAQFVFCIDEREESIRRALEEADPRVETFGAAGFFGMAIDYLGLDDHEPAAYCPVVVTPAHEVHEAPLFNARDWHRLRARLRAGWHRLERGLRAASRSLLGGAGAAVFFGPAAGVLATGRIIAPRASMKAWDNVTGFFAPPPATQLLSLRQSGELVETLAGGPQKALGFSLDEAADRVTSLLKSIGLTENVARVVVILGHGSTSLNNPHESAHDCGACGGRRGGANARLFAGLANRSDVRAAVAARGVKIPDDTWFVGGLHDTADDGVDLFDLDQVPPSHHKDVEAAVLLLDGARRESARERCRRFENAPLGISADDALDHVEGRASNLGQPRPEYGHCTNATAIVGRRRLSRGLHLDRRAFLVSYDPDVDVNDGIIERVLAAVGPVGAGINLEYYFSSIDNEVYGCGTKLPHNVTGLLGVMNGHQGDLRTGLPLQMVELHEPMRLLLIVEASPDSLLAVAGRQAEVRELVTRGWVQLVSVHPQTGAIMVFENGAFVAFDDEGAAQQLPVVERSWDWHGKSREFVSPALIEAALPAEPASAQPGVSS